MMKISITPTGRFEQFQGITCRIWIGELADGGHVELMIPCVRAHASDDAACAELQSTLREIKAERQLTSFDTRLT